MRTQHTNTHMSKYANMQQYENMQQCTCMQLYASNHKPQTRQKCKFANIQMELCSNNNKIIYIHNEIINTQI